MDLQDARNLSIYSGTFSGENSRGAEIEESNAGNPENIEHEFLLSKWFDEGLPVQATSNDAREVVRFLRNKPSGLSSAEILSSEPRRIFESRKIDAYEYWGIILREGDRVKLTSLGDKLSQIVASENEIFERILSSVPIYVEIIKWIDHQKIKLVTHPDVIEFFSRLHAQHHSIKMSEAEIVSFFSICHGAELGVATVGKRGQPARLKIDPKRIEEFLSLNQTRGKLNKIRSNSSAVSNYSINGNSSGSKSSIIQRVYLSGASSSEIVENLSEALELADFETVDANEVEKDDQLQSGRLQKMQICQAGIIFINDHDCSSDLNDITEIDDTRLTEITAAAGLFNWRVIIIWNSAFPIPEYLQIYNLQLLVNTPNNIKIGFQTVKMLKEMRCQRINQTDG